MAEPLSRFQLAPADRRAADLTGLRDGNGTPLPSEKLVFD